MTKPAKRQSYRASKFEYGFLVEDGVVKATLAGPKKIIGMNIHDAMFEIKKDKFMLVDKTCDFREW